MKREPIKTPLLPKALDSDFSESLAIFKLILRFMNDDSLSGKKEEALANYIAYKVCYFLIFICVKYFINELNI